MKNLHVEKIILSKRLSGESIGSRNNPIEITESMAERCGTIEIGEEYILPISFRYCATGGLKNSCTFSQSSRHQIKLSELYKKSFIIKEEREKIEEVKQYIIGLLENEINKDSEKKIEWSGFYDSEQKLEFPIQSGEVVVIQMHIKPEERDNGLFFSFTIFWTDGFTISWSDGTQWVNRETILTLEDAKDWIKIPEIKKS